MHLPCGPFACSAWLKLCDGDVVLLQVPLGVKSCVRVWAINDGYDNLELSVRLPPDPTHLPVAVAFTEGKLIGLAKERLPLDISCCSNKPLSFTTTIDLLDEDGRAFSLTVTGATDNCSLSHVAFMQVWLHDALSGLQLPEIQSGALDPSPDHSACS